MSNHISLQIDRIIDSDHHDPFVVLGLHFIDQESPAALVRTFQPYAESVQIVINDTKQYQGYRGIQTLKETWQHHAFSNLSILRGTYHVSYIISDTPIPTWNTLHLVYRNPAFFIYEITNRPLPK